MCSLPHTFTIITYQQMKLKSILVTILLMVATHHTALAQNDVSIILTKAPWVTQMPTELLSYLNDPFQYVSITLVNNTPAPLDVYINFDLSTSASIEGQDDVHIYSDLDKIGGYHNITSLLHLNPGANRMSAHDLHENLMGRINFQLDYSNINLNTFTMPEGNYSFCVTVAKEGQDLSLTSCLKYNLCYSGSAPMITSPILTETDADYPTLTPMRKINFMWTGVVSNCLRPNQFNYTIRFVEVYKNQNPQLAIEGNPVIASINCGKHTFYIYDILTDKRLIMDSGHVYAMQVLATPSNDGIIANISNDGYSDFVVFEWPGNDAIDPRKNHKASR